IQKCDADGTVNASGSYYLITYDGTDRSASIVANSWKIASRPWITGDSSARRRAAVMASNFIPCNPVGVTSRDGRCAAIVLEEEPEDRQ
ncbi:MAG: hypothetical protein IIZ06_09740, partial [Kiritimatiellae bacterium]|nr:hypothetical protein [Kiritimatiellia bacterium]